MNNDTAEIMWHCAKLMLVGIFVTALIVGTLLGIVVTYVI